MERLPQIAEVRGLAEVFMASGMFKDVKDLSQAMVKIIAGSELGLAPIAAMRSIDLVEGQITLRAHALAALIMKAGYVYTIVESTPERCEITFKKGDEIRGTTVYSWAEAQQAGLTGKQNWKRYPQDMLYSRCMARGARQHCADALMGAAYVEGELDDPIDDDVSPGAYLQSTEPPPQIEETPASDKQRHFILGLLKKYGALEGYKRRTFDAAYPDGASKAALSNLIEAFDMEDRIPDRLFGPYIKVLREDKGVAQDDVVGFCESTFQTSRPLGLTHQQQLQLAGWLAEHEPPTDDPVQASMGLKLDWSPQIRYYSGALDIPEADVRGWFTVAFDGMADDEITEVLGKMTADQMRGEINTFVGSLTGPE